MCLIGLPLVKNEREIHILSHRQLLSIQCRYRKNIIFLAPVKKASCNIYCLAEKHHKKEMRMRTVRNFSTFSQ